MYNKEHTSCSIVCRISSSGEKVSGAWAGRNLRRIFCPWFISHSNVSKGCMNIGVVANSLSPKKYPSISLSDAA